MPGVDLDVAVGFNGRTVVENGFDQIPGAYVCIGFRGGSRPRIGSRIGIGVGVTLSFALTRLVASFLYGVTPNDPLTIAAAAMVLVVVAIVAAAAPARRAARSDPVAALRADG